jgi:hypothetical protein
MGGFTLAIVHCDTCSAEEEAIPDGRSVSGLPEGWVSVRISKYKRTSGGDLTSDFDFVGTAYYCSVAHLPAELLYLAEGK